MPKTEPMTLDDMQREIHALFQNGIDVPSGPGDEDYDLRTIFINNVIGASWEHYPGIKWRELYDVDSSKTFNPSITQYATPVGFKEIGGKMKLLRSDGAKLTIDMVPQERLDDQDLGTGPDENSGSLNPCYGYVSGRPGAYFINLLLVPAEWAGATIMYRFYRYAATLVSPSDIPDMDNPRYAVSMVAARLHQLGFNNAAYTVNFNDAQEMLKAMIVKNNSKGTLEKTAPIGHRISQNGVMGM